MEFLGKVLKYINKFYKTIENRLKRFNLYQYREILIENSY